MEMKSLGTSSGTTEASFNNQIKEIKEIISDIEDNREEIGTKIKKKMFNLKLLGKNLQEIWTLWKSKSNQNRNRWTRRNQGQRNRKYFAKIKKKILT